MLNSPETWIADAGATVQNTPHPQGITNLRKLVESDHIAIGNDQKMEPAAIGYVKGTTTNKTGLSQMSVKLKNVVQAPTLKHNLLSLTKLRFEGWSLKGGNNKMIITKNSVEIIFNVIIKILQEKLFYVNVQRTTEFGGAAFEINKTTYHGMLVHAGDEATSRIAKVTV